MSTHRDRNESGSSVTVFHGRLERVRTTKFGVGDNQANGPINLEIPRHFTFPCSWQRQDVP